MAATEGIEGPAPRRINPPHYFLIALLSMAAIAAMSGDRSVLPGAWPWTGAVLVFAGLLVALRASRQFDRAGTPIVPLTRSSTLVTDGMFAYSRNPMYAGLAAVLAGVAVLLDEPWPWLVVPVFVLAIRQRFIRHEEALMTQLFGDAYRDYYARVRRWI